MNDVVAHPHECKTHSSHVRCGSRVNGTLTVKTTGAGSIPSVALLSSTDMALAAVVIDAAG